MSAVIRACALLARSFDGMGDPAHATLGITPGAARDAAVEARKEYDQLHANLAAADAAKEAAIADSVELLRRALEAEARVKELERQFAAYLLCSQRLSEGFRDEPLVEAPDAIKLLCREHDGKPIGHCSRCSKLAPLVHAGGFSCGEAMVCADGWGCSEKEEPRG